MVLLVLLTVTCTSARAGDRHAILDELRLGLFDQSIDGANSETGVAVNAEALFHPLPSSSGSPALDRMIQPRPHIGATVNTEGDTSLAYAGLTWTIPLFCDWLFAEASFGGAIHDGPLDEPGVASYGCAWAFRESVSLGIGLGEGWQHSRHRRAHVERRSLRAQSRLDQRRRPSRLQARLNMAERASGKVRSGFP